MSPIRHFLPIGKALVEAADKGHQGIVNAIMESERFGDISSDHLGEALLKAGAV